MKEVRRYVNKYNIIIIVTFVVWIIIISLILISMKEKTTYEVLQL